MYILFCKLPFCRFMHSLCKNKNILCGESLLPSNNNNNNNNDDDDDKDDNEDDDDDDNDNDNDKILPFSLSG